MPSPTTIAGIVKFATRLRGVESSILREGLEIISLHRRIDALVENDLSRWGLTARQVEIMESLYHNPEGSLTPADLADEVGLTRSAMTGTLDSLEKLGHVVRRSHPSDRRMVTIHLTPSGREFIGGHLSERYQRLFRSMNNLTPAERSTLLRSYAKVIEFLTAETAETSLTRDDRQGRS